MTPSRLRLAATSVACGLGLAACTVGPDYKRPTPFTSGIAPASSFKELAGWTPATPIDAIDKGAWWSVYADPELDRLERRVAITNQNVAAAEAAFRQARALVAQDRAALFPSVSASTSVTRTGSLGSGGGAIATQGAGGTIVTNGGGSGAVTNFNGSLDASWAPDLWGRIRRAIEQARANAQVSAADLANATLLAQATLAADYFQLRLDDEDQRLLTSTVAAYRSTLRVTTNQYTAGTVARSDVIGAQLQVENAQASLIDVAQNRQVLEHAIAVLTGAPPGDLTLAAATLPTTVPVAPAGLPSALLQRRPDIAASERAVKAANAVIGIQTAAYFPDLTLSGSLGSSANDFGRLFRAQNAVWSLGSSLGETLIDFGARRAAVRGARAAYDVSVANYRQTVLIAFQSVEDQLSNLRVLQDEQAARQRAEASARQAEKLALNQYRAGTVPFTTVITAQTQALSAEQATLNVLASRLISSVSLIQDLGGGWSSDALPKI